MTRCRSTHPARPLVALALASLLALAAGCRDTYSIRSEFEDDHVVSLGKVETPGGTVELGERAIRYWKTYSLAPSDGMGVEIHRGLITDESSRGWYTHVVAVPGVGVMGSATASTLTASGAPQRAYEYASLLPYTGRFKAGYEVVRAIGSDALRPDLVLLVETVYDQPEPRRSTVLVCRKGAAPRRYEGVGSWSLHGDLSLLWYRPKAEPGGKGMGEAAPAKLLVLDRDLEPAGEPVPDARVLRGFDVETRIYREKLPAFVVAPSSRDPSLFAVLGPQGKFVLPPGASGLAPVMIRYMVAMKYDINMPTCSAAISWLVVEETPEGRRWGFARADLATSSGPIWRDVRIQPGPFLSLEAGRDVWIIAQRQDGRWDALVPDAVPAPYTTARPAGATVSAEAAYAAAEACMETWYHATVAQRQAKAREEDAREAAYREKMQPIWDQWERDRVARESFFGTENLIYGKPREESIGQWIDGRQRAAIRDMKDRGVYDAYGRPYDWLNEK